MRQQIRKKMETWVVQNEVKKAQDAANATWKKRWQTKLRFRLGQLTTFVLTLGYIALLTSLLKYEGVISEKVPLVPIVPLSLSVMNVLMPMLIKKIVKKERHFRPVEALQAMMMRIFVIKMVQLCTIMLTLLRIKAADEQDDGSLLAKYFKSGDATAAAGSERCPEAQFGGIFFKLVITDALVFSAMQVPAPVPGPHARAAATPPL
jgi:hypothetical protein